MSQVFLIGTGPLPSHRPTEMGFPHLRARQFLLPMLDAGHDVTVALFVRRDARAELPEPGRIVDASVETARGPRRYRQVVVRPDEPGRFLLLRDLRRQVAPDVIVSAGPFLPMAAGARAAGDEPLWVDVPGDPMSEAQAKALRSGSSEPILRYREMLAWALARGDRFSVISDAQRGPLIGALGLAGRLTADALGDELVSVQRGSVEGLGSASGGTLPEPVADLPASAFVVLFCGGYNTWLDGETLLAGLLRAMDRDPAIHFVSTGGGLRGHDEGSYLRFRSAALASPHARRFHFCGWVPGDALAPLHARAQVSVFCDLPCYEAEFGARTRILESLERGVPVAATDSCDLTHELAGTEGFHPLVAGDPESVASVLVELSAARRAGTAVARQSRGGWETLRERYSLEATTAPLLAWLKHPERAPGGAPVDFLEDYQAELATLQERLEEVWNSATWRYLGRVHKLLGRFRSR